MRSRRIGLRKRGSESSAHWARSAVKRASVPGSIAIAVNSALHGRRWRDRRTRHEAPLEDTVPSRFQSGDALLRMKLERAMKQLPERMRQVLVLHDIEGFTHEEIAEFLGVNAGTSKSQLFKARARMRELLRPVTSEPMKGEEICLT